MYEQRRREQRVDGIPTQMSMRSTPHDTMTMVGMNTRQTFETMEVGCGLLGLKEGLEPSHVPNSGQ